MGYTKVFLLYSIYKQCTKDRVFRAVLTSNLLQALFVKPYT